MTYLPYILHYLNGMCTVKTRYKVADQASLGYAVCAYVCVTFSFSSACSLDDAQVLGTRL